MKRLALSLALAVPAATARAITPATEAAIQEGPHALYNLDYVEARARMHRLIELEPDNPFGYLFEAGAIWWESSNEYGLFKDTPTLEDLFESDIRQALKTSEAYEKAKDRRTRAEGYFAEGMALGTRGQWYLLRGKWVKAYFDGKKAVKHLNKAVKIDPDFFDPYLGLGVYDYQADRLPGILKLGALFMVHGDAKRGLERIQLSIDRGRFISGQAAQFLASIYLLYEKNYPQAMQLIRQLRARYPKSPYFDFLAVTTLYRQGDMEGSYREALGLFGKIQIDPSILGRKQLTLFCGMDGDQCLNPQSLAAAIQWLNKAVEAADSSEPADWGTLLHLFRGVAYDLSNQRVQAVNDYERVLSAAPFADLQERARACLMNHCGRKEILQYLKAMSLAAAPPPELGPTQAPTASVPSNPDDNGSRPNP